MAAFAGALVVLFGIISAGAIVGIPMWYGAYVAHDASGTKDQSDIKNPRRWVPKMMSLVDVSSCAELADAEVSEKKSSWNEKSRDLDAVVGAQLRGANLQYAFGFGAFFARADLSASKLEYANLIRSDLSDADLTDAQLAGADLSNARLPYINLTRAHSNGTDFSRADLTEANLTKATFADAEFEDAKLDAADLTYGDFRGANDLTPEQLMSASHWDRAFFDKDVVLKLGCPADHNDLLEEWRDAGKDQFPNNLCPQTTSAQTVRHEKR